MFKKPEEDICFFLNSNERTISLVSATLFNVVQIFGGGGGETHTNRPILHLAPQAALIKAAACELKGYHSLFS